MFAVIKTGGKQYRVQQGDVLQVEKLGVEKDKTVTFEEVLLVEDGKNTLIGTPFVEKARVHAVVVEDFKDDKVLVFKKKRRKQYKKMHGHRQELTRVRIENITIGAKAPKKAEPAEPKPKVTKKERPKKAKAPAAKPVETRKPAPKKTEAEKPVKKAAAPKPKTTKPKTGKVQAKAAPEKSDAPKAKKMTKTKEK